MSGAAATDGRSFDGLRVDLDRVALSLQGRTAAEVRDFLSVLQQTLEPIYFQFSNLLGENDRLRGELTRTSNRASGGDGQEDEAHGHAIALLTQAQELTDSLIDDARQEARDLVWAARAHQKELARKVTSSPPAAAAEVADDEGVARIRSYAKVAQGQFLLVIEALKEEVNRLAEEDTEPADPIPVVPRSRQAS